MKGGLPMNDISGFTIVEIMIVMAVTLIIFFAAVIAINGRTSNTAFLTAVQEFQSELEATMNDVANGSYNPSNITCALSADGINGVLDNGGSLAIAPGSNASDAGDCMYLGKALQFTTGNTYYVYDVLGSLHPLSNPTQYSVTYADAIPQISLVANLWTSQSLGNELVAQWMTFSKTAGASLDDSDNTTGVVSFLDDPGTLSVNADISPTVDADNSTSGAVEVNLIPTPNTTVNSWPANNQTLDQAGATGAINYSNSITPTLASSLTQTADGDKNPAGGIGICFKSLSTDQSVLFTFGGSNRKSTIENKVYGGTSC